MPLKTIDRRNIKPHKIKDSYVIFDDGHSVEYGVSEFIDTDITTLNNDEWYRFFTSFGQGEEILADNINGYIVNNYGDRVLMPAIMHKFDGWIESDYDYLSADITGRTTHVLLKNREKYKKLFDAMTLEFNPLWNVDGTETTTRTLEKDGTITNARDGSDTIHDVTDGTVLHSGTDTFDKDGTDTIAHSGTITTGETGTDTTAYSGSETDSKNGTRTLSKTGGNVETKYRSTTDSNSFLPTEKTSTEYGDGSGTANHDKETETETFNNYNDVKTFTNRQNQETKNLTTTQTNNNSDTTTYNSTTTETKNLAIDEDKTYDRTTEYDSSDTQTFDTIDTERVTHERHGNIGVTTTTKLLTEYWDMAMYMDFVDAVCKDCLASFTIGVY